MCCIVQTAPRLKSLKTKDYVNTNILEVFGRLFAKCARNGGDAGLLELMLKRKARFGGRLFTYERLRRYGVGSPMIEEDGMFFFYLWCFEFVKSWRRRANVRHLQ